MNRLVAVALSACALCAVIPSAAPAAAGPPDIQPIIDCFAYASPPIGPVGPALISARCLVSELT
jgi:hypothetical protein